MEVVYRKNNMESFMIITPENLNEQDYKLQMVLNNHIKGLVPVTVKMLDNQNKLYYDTTALISLKSLYAAKKISGEDILQFLEAFKRLSENMREYLLDYRNIMYDLDYIFVREPDGQFFFCYDAQGDSNLNKCAMFFDSLLEYVDYEDKKAVEIVYGIQRIVAGGTFTLQNIWELLQRQDETEEEPLEEQREIQKEFIEFPEEFVEPTEKKEFGKQLKKILGKWGKKLRRKETFEPQDPMQDFFAKQDQKEVLRMPLNYKSVRLEKPIVIIPGANPYIIKDSGERN